MKKILVLMMAIVAFVSSAQVRVINPPAPKKVARFEHYDSISNKSLYKPELLIGQELFLIPKKGKEQRSYSDFTSDGEKVNNDELANHTFKILGAEENKKYTYEYLFELEDIETGIHYKYTYSNFSTWPFITLGYKAKFEAKNKGKLFVSRGKVEKVDVNTEKLVTNEGGGIWTFQEVVAYSGEVGYLFTNKKKEAVVFSEDEWRKLFPKSTIDKYRKRYGNYMCNQALKGYIEIGMPEDLVLVAYGKPSDIDDSSFGDTWIYKYEWIDVFLIFFENGKVTGWD